MKAKIKQSILLILVVVMSFSIFACGDPDVTNSTATPKSSIGLSGAVDENNTSSVYPEETGTFNSAGTSETTGNNGTGSAETAGTAVPTGTLSPSATNGVAGTAKPSATSGTNKPSATSDTVKPTKKPSVSVSGISGTIKLTYPNYVYSSDANKRGIRTWINEFKSQYPNVNIVEDATDIATYSNRIAAKDIGDVFWFLDTDLYNYAISSQALLPLDSYIDALNIDMNNVYAGFRKLGEIDGQMYFVAADCGQQTFAYNKRAIKAAGLEMPQDDWTWSDFKNYVEKLTVTNADGTLAQVGAAMDVWNAPMYVPFFQGFGGQWYDSTNKRITLTTDEGVMTGMGELIEVLENMWVYPNRSYSIVVPQGSYATAFSSVSEDISRTAVFQQLDSYKSLYMTGSRYDAMGIDWDVVAYPLFDSPASPCGTFGYGVFKYTKNPDAAAAFCLSLYTEEGQNALNSSSGGSVPILNSLKDTTYWHLTEEGFENINYGAFTANTDSYIPSQVVGRVPVSVSCVIADGMQKLFKDFYSGGTSWFDNLAMIEIQANQEWQRLLG